MGNRNICFQKKSTSLNPMTLEPNAVSSGHPFVSEASQASGAFKNVMRFQVVALGSLALDCAIMDILREFLESSTIHGITYISTEKVKFLCKISNHLHFCNRPGQPRFFGFQSSALVSLVPES